MRESTGKSERGMKVETGETAETGASMAKTRRSGRKRKTRDSGIRKRSGMEVRKHIKKNGVKVNLKNTEAATTESIHGVRGSLHTLTPNPLWDNPSTGPVKERGSSTAPNPCSPAKPRTPAPRQKGCGPSTMLNLKLSCRITFQKHKQQEWTPHR